jgi:amino acid transporter
MLAAVAFFLPSAFAIIRLARKYPDQGGMYVWAREKFGEAHGFLCAWFYFLSKVIGGCVLLTLLGRWLFISSRPEQVAERGLGDALHLPD